MSLRVFTALSHLTPAIRGGAMVEAQVVARALRTAFGRAATLSHASSIANVTMRGAEMPLAKFMQQVLAEDAAVLKALKAEMTPAAFKELSNTITVAKGMSTLSKESFHMLRGVRSQLDDVAESLRLLKAENKLTAETFEAALKESAKQSAKSAKMLEEFQNIGKSIANNTSKGTFARVGKLFSYAVPTVLIGGGVAGTWAFLHNYAKKNSGCFIFLKKTSTRYRVTKLSNGMGLKVANCTGCELTHETESSANYQNFINSKEICDKNLCKLESLKPPFCNSKLYTMSCIELDEADALADIVGGIGPGIMKLASGLTQAVVPYAIVAGLGYLGFTYITTPKSTGSMIMMSRTPYYERLDEKPKRKKSISEYPGPLKKKHP